jgi:hypothetical protein
MVCVLAVAAGCMRRGAGFSRFLQLVFGEGESQPTEELCVCINDLLNCWFAPQRHQEEEMAEVYLHKDEIIVVRTEDYYEEQASQEEIYLEETEEDLRMILEFDDPSPAPDENLREQREHAAEELITGDSDDPPLSDEAIDEILGTT